MPGGVKREFHIVDGKNLIIIDSRHVDLAQTVTNYRYVILMGKVLFVSPSGMVCMAMCDECFSYWFPWIEINASGLAINSFFSELK
jgi:hypothetical protein